MRSALAIVAVMGLALHAMGQPLWCAGGEPWIWSSEVRSRHNSQHLFDPYTLSHVSHGLLLAIALRVVLVSLDHFGDSVANSIGDLLAMMAGHLAAARLRTREAVAAFIAFEIGLALWIRDGVLLNVLMLVAPAEAVRTWQLDGAPR